MAAGDSKSRILVVNLVLILNLKHLKEQKGIIENLGTSQCGCAEYLLHISKFRPNA
jgi:hypothetical protein